MIIESRQNPLGDKDPLGIALRRSDSFKAQNGGQLVDRGQIGQDHAAPRDIVPEENRGSH